MSSSLGIVGTKPEQGKSGDNQGAMKRDRFNGGVGTGLRAQNQGWPTGIVTAQLLTSRTSRPRAFGPALGVVARRKPSRPSPDSPIVLERDFGSREGSFERGEGGW
ncbi:hypothetical protein E4U48_005362 [Claviceps purpurea]|nr:hypothetical protein E4U26_007755 [Claviceps purpurea]KAG6245146.1 hypothetical protein E4U23_005640 [Claviceps purpurea]KAG6266751.1 hypothetical protein E4U48_005362 [Claviceps purpurea]KAG6273995.1 hypothetical protein E4U49_006503 [Claviceps purpurea]